ncbi:hypothetical protein IFM89_037842 [Coptis chinensis]|uniref:N-acetylglucosaminylphosphatidylinositol deacetylase n=1 Tax=Coptis chinensis TaxID=261450 RepID=A0A835HRW6_9MAGN|nr:hypothetical protein IFM89_037842 [Coptis chinensis]
MDWFLVLILFLLLLWVVSLCKILYYASRVPTVSFLSKGEFIILCEDAQKRKVILVVAHPDDEAMFFSPTILYLTSKGHTVHILCLSTGNADGKGNVRKEELYHACSSLKVPRQHIKILDHPDLQDGFDNMWSSILIAKIIKEETASLGLDLLITFDSYGISGHRNHRDVHNGVCTFLCEDSQRGIEAWELLSTSIIRKYSGPMDLWLSALLASSSRGQMHCLLNEHPVKSFMAMAQHQSQWIWFRKLFVVFSSYTYVNMLRKINL